MPVAGGAGAKLCSLTADCLDAAKPELTKAGIEHFVKRIRGSTCADARNHGVTSSLEQVVYTHFVFIDSDITFTPYDLLRLLAHGREVGIIGAHYPRKWLEWERVRELSPEDARDPEKVRRIVSRQEWDHTNEGDEVRVDLYGCRQQVDQLPGGFLCLSREALEWLREQDGHTAAYRKGLDHWTYGFFLDVIDSSRTMVGEDIYFCRKARALGHSVWELKDIELGHIGEVEF